MIREPTKEMPEIAAQEQVATADTERDNTSKLEEPDVETPATDGIYEAGGRSDEVPLRDTAALGNIAPDDSGDDLMDTNDPRDPGKETGFEDDAASTPLRRTLRFGKKSQKVKGF